MGVLDAVHLKKNNSRIAVSNTCSLSEYLFLYVVPGLSSWVVPRAAVSEGRSLLTVPCHDQTLLDIPACNSWPVHSAILVGLSGLLHICTAHTSASNCLRTSKFIRERAGCDTLAVIRTVPALVQEQHRTSGGL